MMFANGILAQVSDSVKMFRVGVVVAACGAATGCHNYTSKPMCTEANAVVPSGITGTYTLSVQYEDFSTETQEFDVRYNKASGRLTMAKESEVLRDSSLCAIGGQYIQESYHELLDAYEQERLFVTSMGLTTAPVFYDIHELQALGIRTKIVEVPGQLAEVAGGFVSRLFSKGIIEAAGWLKGEAVSGLLIDNDTVSANTVFQAARTGPVGVSLLRK